MSTVLGAAQVARDTVAQMSPAEIDALRDMFHRLEANNVSLEPEELQDRQEVMKDFTQAAKAMETFVRTEDFDERNAPKQKGKRLKKK